MSANGVLDDMHYCFEPLKPIDLSQYSVDEEELKKGIEKNREIIRKIREFQKTNNC